MHGPDCVEPITGKLVFIRAIHSVEWVKAIDRRTGMENKDYVSLPSTCFLADTETHATEERELIILIAAEGAQAIVEGIASLLNEGPPPSIQLPGAN